MKFGKFLSSKIIFFVGVHFTFYGMVALFQPCAGLPTFSAAVMVSPVHYTIDDAIASTLCTLTYVGLNFRGLCVFAVFTFLLLRLKSLKQDN